MRLSPGTQLGSYEIVSLLGAGGMGEVYRARDPRLKREVALKVLPDGAAVDADRRERFTREALAVAALNHPHIVTIHSVEDAGTAVFLTMELVEGRSLAEALPATGLPIDRVLTIGIAVADATSAAHQKGITHRDLKPGNIMLGEGEQAGRIKVLDFGLAKVVDAQRGAAGASMLPTEAPAHTAPITAEGRILGTVAYMSPEQAEGRTIDGRSDLFSLGVVLYEMATGRRPFAGDTNLSILSSILKDTPKSVTDINPAIPPELGRIIRRALAKDPERRYQTAKDLRNDLEDLKASLGSGESPLPATSNVAASPASSFAPAASLVPSSDTQIVVSLVRRHSRAFAVAAAVLLLGAAGALYGLLRSDAQPASSQQSFTNLQVTQLTTSGNAERPAISADGRYVAYVQRDGDDQSLWIRQTATTNTVRIVPPERGVALFGATFTPDGTSVDFVRQASRGPWEIWRVPFLGGTPRLFVANVASPISWAPDGQRIAFLRTRVSPKLSSQLFVADADGGRERELANQGDAAPWVSLVAPWRPSFPPAWSPDGRLIALVAAGSPNGRIVFVDSGSGSIQDSKVLNGSTGAMDGLTWLDARSLVLNHPTQLGAPGQLIRQPYPAGPLSKLTNDPNNYVGISLSGDRRRLVTGRRDARMDLWVGDGGAGTGADVVPRVPVSLERVVWAGDRLLYGGVVGGKPAILRVTPGENTQEDVVLEALAPAATSDGRTIVFVSSADNTLDLWTADANGRRKTRLVPAVTAEQVAVTPDDRYVLYTSLLGGTVSIWMVSIEGGSPMKLAAGRNAAVSPDGGSIVFTAEVNGVPALLVCGLPACSSPKTIGAGGFETAVSWTPDGRGVAYPSDGNLWVQPLSGGAPRQFTRFTDGRPIGSFAWSRDGRRLAITRSTITNDIVLFEGLN
jgi:serine/threonine protein kinase